jgi:cephalosporin-C deacetylase
MKDPKLLEIMKVYKGRDDVPDDFDSFWNQALANVFLQ